MDLRTISYETQNDVSTITLLEPYSDMQMVRELTKVCDHLEDENPSKVVVFKGQKLSLIHI